MKHASEESLALAVDAYLERVEKGETPSPLDYSKSTGPNLQLFLEAVEAKAALQAIIEPRAHEKPPEELGPYHIRRRLGRGAAGTVYAATDTRTNRPVALKLLHAELRDSDPCVRRFLREGRLGAKVRHPNLIVIHETGVIGNQPYSAMELIDGTTLKQEIESGPLRPTAESLSRFVGIAEGLARLHDQGILHRDVKPSNIMVSQDGQLRLGDYGLMRSALESSITGTGETVGTVAYMSPEQFQGSVGQVDQRSDVYSLGATLYEAFTGRPAVDIGSIGSMLLSIRDKRPADPRTLAPELSAPASAVIMKALEKRPGDRYQTIQSMADDLRHLADNKPVAARTISPATRWVRNHRRTAAALGVLVLALGAFVYRWATRPALLQLTSHPSAQIYVNGTPHGETPRSIEVEPGRLDVKLMRPRFKVREFTVDLSRGANPTREERLDPLDPADRQALLELLQSYGVKPELCELLFRNNVERGANLPVGRALFPRGKCRLDDLRGAMVFETSPAQPFPKKGMWVIRRGSELLWEKAYTGADTFTIQQPFPEEARRKLRPGDNVSWGFVGDGGEEYLAEVSVVTEPQDLAQQLADIDEAVEGMPSPVRVWLRARVLMRAGLCTAAYASTGPGRSRNEQHVLILGSALEALATADVQDSLAGASLRQAVERLPEEQRRAWFE